ncbi:MULTISPECIES: polysaccharide deacetylase family protein [Haloferacaceae]|uniref:Polysaccharide deacetylase family protein n=1 Tax=Halorubrum glutamatedens TaxID=2707018 RepID=A0ABD5QSJ6_9EURY|nr:polysaccharide deacetylase family protein [Halobellus captivus]
MEPSTEHADPTRTTVPDGYEFALCLTHDVDRPYKTYQAPYAALSGDPLYHLSSLRPSVEPYWQFEEIMRLESELGVRSAFYFLNEPSLFESQPLREWVRPANLLEHAGRYDPTDAEIASIIRRLDEGGWEVGLHGSFHSATDRDRLAEEKGTLESILEREINGGRQHHLKLSDETWEYHRDIGLRYDSSLGSSSSVGFSHGYDLLRPFGDEFVVFPLTAMEVALPDPSEDMDVARSVCANLVDEAASAGAVMTVLWHPRYFNEREFPGYRDLYRWVIEYTLDSGGWVGAPNELLDATD